MTIQFEPLEALKGPQIGFLWSEQFRSDFPNVEEHQSISHVVELRQRPLVQRGRPQMAFLNQSPAPRVLFINEAGNELIQLQSDRLSFNWRRSDKYDYRRYSSLRASFESQYASLCQFVEREELGDIVSDQCELVYVNHVLYPTESSAHKHPGELIEPFNDEYSQLAGASLEDMNLHLQHVLSNESGEFLGRLYVEVSPGFTADAKIPLYKVQFTARGAPLGEGLEGSLSFLDLAHDRLIVAFQEFMSTRVQNQWRNA
jgi:uncharacterized protein (TIGR04255 family)